MFQYFNNRKIFIFAAFHCRIYLTSKEMWMKISQNLRQKVQDDNEVQWGARKIDNSPL